MMNSFCFYTEFKPFPMPTCCLTSLTRAGLVADMLFEELYGVAPKLRDYSCLFISSVISTLSSILFLAFDFMALRWSLSLMTGELEFEIFSSLFTIAIDSST